MRKYTNKIVEMVDEGLLDRDTLIRDLLNWMPESHVEEFYGQNIFDDDNEMEDDDDGQPSEMDEWKDFYLDC